VPGTSRRAFSFFLVEEMRLQLRTRSEARASVFDYIEAFYHAERPHQGIDKELITPGPRNDSLTGETVEHERLGRIDGMRRPAS
jgi:hypothetical protein